ncbi:YdcF family protein [Jiangella muralis]|uniref:YdcF family protein n=1 Tax=Jiangella muralis TaxID=702383 RepID=UPI00069D87EC|nr:YdcF family protein [Jiangella muralis]
MRRAWVAGVLGAVLLWGEYEHWRASYRRLGDAPTAGGSEAVVVLGYRDAGPRANAMNRWRVRAGLRSRRPGLGPSRLVVCGGSTAGPVPEATLMARYARAGRGYDGDLRLEPDSRTTWENIRNVAPLLADADRIKIVSHPLHAEKGRAYLHRAHPELARRLVRGADYRFGEWILLKPALAVYGRRRLRRLDRGAR